MTVSTEISSNEYTGNGVTTDFDYKFRIFKANQLSVITSDADGDNVVTLRLGTDYTVTGANKSAGGKVILTKPLANGHKISIARDIPITQETSFRNQSKFFAEMHEDAFDYLTMILQRIWGSLGSLYLKRPSILANWFDAKGYRIANLGKPKRDSDAVDLGTLKDEISGVNSTILKREKRLLRVDDIDIPALPKVSERRNKQIGFDSSGMPTLLDPAETGALGYILVDSFEKGALITSRYQALHFEYQGEFYRWDGDLPKAVPADSTPQSTGGIGKGAWVSVGDASLRGDLGKVVKKYPSVIAMQADQNLTVGSVVETISYHDNLKIGGAVYQIIDDISKQNGVTRISVKNGNLTAELMWDGVDFDAAWSGAKLDGVTDDHAALHRALKSLGSFGITSSKNIKPFINLIIPSSFRLSKTLWCGYVNINIKCNGKALIDSSNFNGDCVIDFDYSLLRAPSDVIDIIQRDAAAMDGGWHGWNQRHYIDLENTNPNFEWKNKTALNTVKFLFNSNPSIGDVIYINASKVVFGSDVTIGGTSSETNTNLVNYINSNFKFPAYTISNWAEIYSGNPWTCRSMTPAISVSGWVSGVAGVRVSNMWNGRISFLSCSNFDVQLWENPCNKKLADSSYSEFGMENNEYDLGKSQNCQIVHLASPVVRDFSALNVMPYCIDTRFLSGSVRVSNLKDAATHPHYVNAIACKYIRVKCTGAIEAETAGNVTADHALCIIVGNSENYDMQLEYMAERYNYVGKIYDAEKTGRGVRDIYIRTTFGDSTGKPKFSDNSRSKQNYANILHSDASGVVEIEDKFTCPVFVAGKIGKLRDGNTGNITISGMRWYKREDISESSTAPSTAFWDTATSNVKCDGYNGIGVTVSNDNRGAARIRVDHSGGDGTAVCIRYLNLNGAAAGNVGYVVGAAYDIMYSGFVSVNRSVSMLKCTIPANTKAQIFIVNASNLVESAIAKSLRVMQYHNELMIYKD